MEMLAIGVLIGSLVTWVVAKLRHSKEVEALGARLADGRTDRERLIRELERAGWIDVTTDEEGEPVQIVMRKAPRWNRLSPNGRARKYLETINPRRRI